MHQFQSLTGGLGSSPTGTGRTGSPVGLGTQSDLVPVRLVPVRLEPS